MPQVQPGHEQFQPTPAAVDVDVAGARDARHVKSAANTGDLAAPNRLPFEQLPVQQVPLLGNEQRPVVGGPAVGEARLRIAG